MSGETKLNVSQVQLFNQDTTRLAKRYEQKCTHIAYTLERTASTTNADTFKEMATELNPILESAKQDVMTLRKILDNLEDLSKHYHKQLNTSGVVGR